MSGLIYRLSYLAVYERTFLQEQSDARSMRMITLPVSRGTIFDRNGYPLAASRLVESLWVNPAAVELPAMLDGRLAAVIGMSNKDLAKRLSKSGKSFLYLKRHMSPQAVTLVKEMDLPGVYFQQEYKRYYPDSDVTAHLLGRTNIDDNGQEGLELAYNNWLSGTAGKALVTQDRFGRPIAETKVLEPSKQGHDLHLSLDRDIQYLSYQYLLAGVAKAEAKAASVVVLDARSGEVLAMSNYPSYDPNNAATIVADKVRNRAVTDLFEPGSTIKAITMLNVIENGQYSDNEKIDIGNGTLTLEGHTIRDVHPKASKISYDDIITRSSNVGIVKLAFKSSADSLLAKLKEFGFGEGSGSGFPGEASGILADSIKTASFDHASLSYGYGMSTTVLQLARAYMKIASSAKVNDIEFLRQKQTKIDDQQSSSYSQLRKMLTNVTLSGGTAVKAGVKGYSVAGKTGTSYIASKNGYDESKYIASFVGFAPAKQPKYVIAVVLWEPSFNYRYGGRSAAPIFADIMQHLLVFKKDNYLLSNDRSMLYN